MCQRKYLKVFMRIANKHIWSASTGHVRHKLLRFNSLTNYPIFSLANNKSGASNITCLSHDTLSSANETFIRRRFTWLQFLSKELKRARCGNWLHFVTGTGPVWNKSCLVNSILHNTLTKEIQSNITSTILRENCFLPQSFRTRFKNCKPYFV